MTGTHSDKKNWWLILERIVFLISIGINIFLWNKSELEKKQVDCATYNDNSWKSVSDFSAKLEKFEIKVSHDIDNITYDKSLLYEQYVNKIRKLNEIWTEDAVQSVSELKTKLESYEKIVGYKLEATKFAEVQVKRIDIPLSKSLVVIDAQISERQKNHEEAQKNGVPPQLVAAEMRGIYKYREDIRAMVNETQERIKKAWSPSLSEVVTNK